MPISIAKNFYLSELIFNGFWLADCVHTSLCANFKLVLLPRYDKKTVAKTLKKEGKEEEAKKAILDAKQNFKKAVEIDPTYEKAKKNLARVSLAIPVQL